MSQKKEPDQLTSNHLANAKIMIDNIGKDNRSKMPTGRLPNYSWSDSHSHIVIKINEQQLDNRKISVQLRKVSMDAVTFIYRDDIRPLLLTVYLISPVSGDNSVYFVGPDYVKISLEKIVYGEEWSDLGTVVLDGVTTDEAEDAIQLKEREVALQEENTVQFGGASGEMVEAEQDDEGVDQLYSD